MWVSTMLYIKKKKKLKYKNLDKNLFFFLSIKKKWKKKNIKISVQEVRQQL